MADITENIRLIKRDLAQKFAEDGHIPEEVKTGANGIWYTYISSHHRRLLGLSIRLCKGRKVSPLQALPRNLRHLCYNNFSPTEIHE